MICYIPFLCLHSGKLQCCKLKLHGCIKMAVHPMWAKHCKIKFTWMNDSQKLITDNILANLVRTYVSHSTPFVLRTPTYRTICPPNLWGE